MKKENGVKGVGENKLIGVRRYPMGRLGGSRHTGAGHTSAGHTSVLSLSVFGLLPRACAGLEELADGDQVLEGGKGNDVLFGGAGNDKISGGDGNDELQGRAGNDTLNGNKGNDKLFGEEGDDTLFGNEGKDFFYGGDGDDTLNGNEGDDVLRGEEGNDAYVFNLNETGLNTITDKAGTGDSIELKNASSASDVNLVSNGITLKITYEGNTDWSVTINSWSTATNKIETLVIGSTTYDLDGYSFISYPFSKGVTITADSLTEESTSSHENDSALVGLSHSDTADF